MKTQNRTKHTNKTTKSQPRKTIVKNTTTSAEKPQSGQDKIYAMMTDKIIDMLNKGVVAWRKPWDHKKHGVPQQNYATRHVYRGFNIAMLASQGYDSPYWLTYNQAQDLGGQVRTGEKGTPILQFIPPIDEEKDPETGEVSRKWKPGYYRYFTVFNAAQIDGITFPELPNVVLNPTEVIETAERVVNDMTSKPTIEHRRGDRAYYQPVRDHIVLPQREQFNSSAEYYGTLWHEIAHSTGHENRLNREGVTDLHLFGDHEYSVEELVAEFTVSFVAGVVGIERDTVENSAAYIASWSKVLKDDPRLIVKAAAAAQRAADFILGTLHTEPETPAIVAVA